MCWDLCKRLSLAAMLIVTKSENYLSIYPQGFFKWIVLYPYNEILWNCPQNKLIICVVVLVSVQFSCSVMYDSLRTHGLQPPGFPVLHYLLEFAHTHVHWVDDAIQPTHPLLPHLLLPSIFPNIRVFSRELALRIGWPKYWSFSFSTSPSKDYSELNFFRIDRLDLPAVQGTLKSLLQHHSSKASILSLIYGLTVTFVYDHGKDQSFA